jgi:hypothetical protein
MDTLLHALVASWAKHSQRFLAAIVQLYRLTQADAEIFCREYSFRTHTQSAAPHYSLHPP